MPRLTSWLLVTVMTAVAAATATVLWRAGLLLGNDGPQHLYVGFVAAHVDDARFAPFWQTRWSASSRGFVELFGATDALFGWRDGYRIAVAVVALLLGAASAAVIVAARSPGPARRWLALLAFPAALSWSLYLGFFPYVLATALGLFGVAFLVSRPTLRRREVALIACLALVVAVVHVVAAVFFAVATCFIVGARTLVVDERQEFLSVAAASVAAGAVIAPVVFVGLLTTSTVELGGEPAGWLPLPERLAQIVTHFLPGPLWRSGLAVLALAGGAFAMVRPAQPMDRALAAAGVAFVLVTLVLPFTGSWQLVSPRSLVWALPLLLAAIPVERLARVSAMGGRPGRVELVVASATLAWCGAALVWSDAFHASLSARRDQLLAYLAAGPAPTAPLRLPLILTPVVPVAEVPALDQAIHIGQVSGAAWGGFVFYTHTGTSVHVVSPRAELEARAPAPPAPRVVFAARAEHDLAARRARVAALAAQAAAFDDVIVLGLPADIEAFRARGFVARGEGEGWFVGAVPRCLLEITAMVDRPWSFALGDPAGLSPWWSWDVAAGEQKTSLQVPCGPVRVQSDVACTPAELVITNANANANAIRCVQR